MAEPKELMTVGPLQEALALATEAGDLHRLQDVAAMATALQTGAKARGMGIDAENQAAEVVIRAERAMGRVLDEMSAAGMRRTRGVNKRRPTTVGGTATDRAEGDDLVGLPELGVSPKMAHLWRRLAAQWDDARFEAEIARVRELGARLAKVDFYRGPKAEAKRATQARRDIREEEHAEDESLVLTNFDRAVRNLVPRLPDLPNDELVRVGELVRELVSAYNAVRTTRS